MLVIGIDENGLGPLLGPLVVTGVAFETPSYDRERFWSLAGEDLPAADSKVLYSRRRLDAAERATQAWLGLFDVICDTHAALDRAIRLAPPDALPCPPASSGQTRPNPLCVPGDAPLPRWSSGSPGAFPLSAWNRLDAAGVKPRRIGAHVICPGLFNARTAPDGTNKLRLDFELMLGLIDELAAGTDDGVLALCGKIGSTARYGKWLDGAGRKGWKTIEEGRPASVYQLTPKVRAAFIRDADSAHLPVAVASMIGKYLRELEMERLNRELDETGARPVSGYRDRLTAEFVVRTAEQRRRIGLPDACFRRQS